MPRRAALALLVLLLVAACPKPKPIESPPPTPVAQPSVGRARAHPLARGQELGGPNATGRPGDWVLENDEVVFVIDGLGGGGGFAESGGNIIDAADARTRKDELGQVFTYFGVFPRQAVYSAIDAQNDIDASAAIVARGKELYEPDLDVVTEYRLAAGARALRLRTTVTNGGTKPVTGLGLGDALQWGGLEKVAPGLAAGFRGPSRGAFVGGIGRFGSLAIARRDDAITAISGGAWTDTEQQKDVALAPGQSATYERLLLVGPRADSASIAGELARVHGGALGRVEVALVDRNGGHVPAPHAAKVTLVDEAKSERLTMIATGDSENLVGDVPAARWQVAFAPSAGRHGDGTTVDVDVKSGGTARATFAVSDARTSTVGPCVDGDRPVPCKLTIEGIAPAEAPSFGPPHVAGPAKNQITLLPGERVTVPLSEGRYAITASRGPEYELDRKEIAAGENASFALRRVVATPGYVAADFHQHTVLSADSAVSMRDRVVANAAEGVEVAVASEHNVVADFSPIVKELKLEAFLVAIAGDELTSDASKKPWGHANVFPLPVREDRPRGGALPVRDRTPKTVFAEARALPGGPRVVSINHPRTKTNGYFDLLAFDAKTGTSTDPAYDGTFDAMEIWSGRHIGARDHVLVDWFGLLRASHPTTPIAATDTHGIVGQEAGYPRTYVRVAKDDALESWSDARTAEVVRAVRETRDVILTNGPFVTVTANGKAIGGVARVGRGGVVEVKVRVVTASWNTVETAEIRRVRDETPAKIELSPPRKDEYGATVREATHSFKMTADDAFVVVVNGTTPMRPVLNGDPDETRPSAVTGPIWIDADGDGKSLGR